MPRRKLTYILLVLLLSTTLAGCVRIQYDATVHYDQSVTLNTIYAVRDHPVMKLLNIKLDWDQLQKSAAKNGYRTESYQSEDDYEGMVLEKTFRSVDEIMEIKNEWKSGPAGILVPPNIKFEQTKEDGIWFDTYRVQTNLDLRVEQLEQLGIPLSGAPKTLLERYVRQADIRVKLTVPPGVFLEDAGGLDWRSPRSLDFKVYGNEQNDITLVAHIPNIWAWVITILFVIIGLFFVFRKWWLYRKKRQGDRNGGWKLFGILLFVLTLGVLAITIYQEVTTPKRTVDASFIPVSDREVIPTFAVHGLLGTDRTFVKFSQYMQKQGLAHDGALCTVSKRGKTSCSVFDYDSPRPIVRIEFEDNEAALADQVKWLGQAVETYRREREVSFERMYLVGHSMGGVAAVEYALNEPNYQIDKLVTYDSPILGTELANLGVRASRYGLNTDSPAIQDLIPSSEPIENLRAQLDTWPRAIHVLSYAGQGGEFDLISPKSSLALRDYTDNIQTKIVPYDHFSIHRKSDVLRQTAKFLYDASTDSDPVRIK